jgi:hypothetical protein
MRARQGRDGHRVTHDDAAGIKKFFQRDQDDSRRCECNCGLVPRIRRRLTMNHKQSVARRALPSLAARQTNQRTHAAPHVPLMRGKHDLFRKTAAHFSGSCSGARMNGIAHLHASSFSKESIWTHSSDLAARSAPELCKRLALETTEGAGKAGRRLTPMVRVQQESTRQNHSCSRNRPAFPAQWFYGLYVISPVTRLCCHRHLRDASASSQA